MASDHQDRSGEGADVMYHRYMTQAEYDRIVAEGARYEGTDTAPHCNPDVVHEPGHCAYCDGQPSRQRLREASHTPWTPDGANGWGGNMAPIVDDGLAEAEDAEWADALNKLGRPRDDPAHEPVYSADHLPSDPIRWGQYRKRVLTAAIRISVPFTVQTSEGALRCNDGYLAVDARGYPYPIAAEEFELIYEGPIYGSGQGPNGPG